jgi:methyl-accepting chemotaxis protein
MTRRLFGRKDKPMPNDTRDSAILQVVDRYFASIAFTPDGVILRANRNFLDALEYELNDVMGKHHSMFVPQSDRDSAAYQKFWHDLRSGEPFTGQYERITKSGRSIWIQATYAPVFDDNGKLIEVAKVASDITSRVVVQQQVSDGLSALAEGDTTFRVQAAPGSEMYDLAETYNKSVDGLGDVLQVVSNVAGGLDESARDVRKNSSQAAQITQDNASAVESASEDVSSIVGTVAQTTADATESEGSAKAAAKVVESASEELLAAIAGAEEMRKVVDNMAGINQTIEAIAFQTNMLALNAGIEAARAGPSGAGFAVVASEIRNLAARSNSASSEIKALIEQAVKQSLSTEERVKSSDKNLSDVHGSIADVVEKMVAITASAQEQSERLSVLDSTLRNLSSSAQRHAEVAEENSRSAEQLVDFGQQLASELDRFNQAAPTRYSGAA